MKQNNLYVKKNTLTQRFLRGEAVHVMTGRRFRSSISLQDINVPYVRKDKNVSDIESRDGMSECGS